MTSNDVEYLIIQNFAIELTSPVLYRGRWGELYTNVFE
jgi:hypothetical protein